MSEENRTQDNISAVDYDSYIKTIGVNETDPIERLKKRRRKILIGWRNPRGTGYLKSIYGTG